MFDLLIKVGNRLVQAINLAQQFSEYESVVSFHSSFQCLGQLSSFLAQATFRKLSHLFRCRLACNDRFQHRSSKNTHDIGCDTGQFDLGTLQNFLDPIHQSGSSLDEGTAIPGLTNYQALSTKEIPPPCQPSLRYVTPFSCSVVNPFHDDY